MEETIFQGIDSRRKEFQCLGCGTKHTLEKRFLFNKFSRQEFEDGLTRRWCWNCRLQNYWECIDSTSLEYQNLFEIRRKLLKGGVKA